MRRTLVAVALTSSLLTPTVGQTHLLAPLWSLLSFLFAPTTAAAGAEWDPDGLTRSDEGPGWDPNG
jgi:hypothetical protein